MEEKHKKKEVIRVKMKKRKKEMEQGDIRKVQRSRWKEMLVDFSYFTSTRKKKEERHQERK